MANFSPTNYETPITKAPLDWGRPVSGWHKEVKALYLSFKDNEYSKFFYQTDIHALRLLLTRYSDALGNEDFTAAGWKALDDQLGKFGTTMKDRASIRYTSEKKQAEENYSEVVTSLFKNAFKAEDEEGQD